MKSRSNCFGHCIIASVVFAIIMLVGGCGGSRAVDTALDSAENLMESRPDSALSILEAINTSDLNEKSLKARYALLKSMALDKNYVDTTNFNVLQPAIDYYLEYGTPDEKLRTYYYQGRIYQNRNERDSALHCFMRGMDIADKCNDSLTIARTLVVEGILYQSLYDYTAYTDNYLKAANIYHHKNSNLYEFDCLLNALNGSIILRREEQADSIIKLLDNFEPASAIQKQRLHSHTLLYAFHFGSKQNLIELVAANKDSLIYDANGILNLARAFNKLGENENALIYLDYLDDKRISYDTLKYLSIKFPILEDMKKYDQALVVYKDLVDRLEVINSAKFEQKSRSMAEKHQMELNAEREAERNRKIFLIFMVCVAALAMIILIMIQAIRNIKIKKSLALQMARTTELENENLKSENELANQKVRVTELENDNLKTEKEKLTLENINLQLERDKKALEAENLAHRVAELESESEELKELLETHKEMPEEVRKAIQTRIQMLNTYLASQISEHK